MEQATLRIGGMTCQGCVNSVTRVLRTLPGVEAVEVSLDKHEAQLRYDRKQVAPDAFRTAVKNAGFEVL